MSFLEKPLAGVKELIFAETGDAGKVCQISWNVDKVSGAATLLVPMAAYDRFSSRASLRCLQIKVPEARKIATVRKEYGLVKTSGANYYLIRVEFKL